ncbi:hypothetical protein MVEN_00684500 [Mycena venus]|uniref:Uncharacterized protein n=1 Tax=Mycena venus TaxID=2733690 RepID=A0A8H7D514_9AGAR|nr:hypothetical protein MVEN_00684500 [Mycena venus]
MSFELLPQFQLVAFVLPNLHILISHLCALGRKTKRRWELHYKACGWLMSKFYSSYRRCIAFKPPIHWHMWSGTPHLAHQILSPASTLSNTQPAIIACMARL